MCSDGSPFAAPLADFELAHIDEYALIVGKLPDRVWGAPIIGHTPHIHAVVVPRIELGNANVDTLTSELAATPMTVRFDMAILLVRRRRPAFARKLEPGGAQSANTPTRAMG